MIPREKIPPLLLRGLARLIDFGVQTAVLEIAFRCAPLLPESLLTLSEDNLLYVDIGTGIAALVLYTAISERLSGATLGKLLTGMRVVAEDGFPIGLRAALLRNLAFPIDALFFGLIAYSAVARSPTGQRVGDGWAKTVVIWRGASSTRQDWLGWPIGAGAALLLVLASYLAAS